MKQCEDWGFDDRDSTHDRPGLMGYQARHTFGIVSISVSLLLHDISGARLGYPYDSGFQ